VSNKKGLSKIPSIRGRIADRLKQAEERFDESEEDEMSFPEGPGEITLTGPEERGVVALACLILENLREIGGTRAPKRPLESVVRKALATFDRKEVMEIEVEAYEILLWIGSAIDSSSSPTLEESPETEEITRDSSHMELIRWAIAEQADLVMQYYSHGRGELTHRQVTPISLEAETYLHGYCHLRQDDRVFRIQRIAELTPSAEFAPWETDRTPADDPPKRPQPPTPDAPPADLEGGASDDAWSEASSDAQQAQGSDDDQVSIDHGDTDQETGNEKPATSDDRRPSGADDRTGPSVDGETDEDYTRDDGQLSLLGDDQ
jgi:hypothetical protein